MEKHPSPWRTGAFFLCENCGRRADGDPSLQGLAEEWKKDFKSRMRESGHSKDIRVMVSGCVGLCPPQKQAAAWCPSEGKAEAFAFEAGEKEGVFTWLKGRLDGVE